ncbi:focadhesin-like [Aplochiton taeniatus]
MGHTRNAAYGATAVKHGDTKEITDFLFHVFAYAVVSWGDDSMPLLLGIRAQWFQWHQSVKIAFSSPPLNIQKSFADNTLPLCLLGMPHSLRQLLAKEPWKGQSQKFIDWLFSITESPENGFSELSIRTAKAALLALKSSSEFKKKAVWTKACGW